jgi:hypothetical protein
MKAFVSVLRSNFKNIGPGAKKIERGEFAIQDSLTKRDVDLTLPWESCFYPGQKVDMSMVFDTVKGLVTQCPKCQEDNGDNGDEIRDIEWFVTGPRPHPPKSTNSTSRKCGLIYRQITSRKSQLSEESLDNQAAITTSHIATTFDYEMTDSPRLYKNEPTPEPQKIKQIHDEDRDIALFQRVRIKRTLSNDLSVYMLAV